MSSKREMQKSIEMLKETLDEERAKRRSEEWANGTLQIKINSLESANKALREELDKARGKLSQIASLVAPEVEPVRFGSLKMDDYVVKATFGLKLDNALRNIGGYQ